MAAVDVDVPDVLRTVVHALPSGTLLRPHHKLGGRRGEPNDKAFQEGGARSCPIMDWPVCIADVVKVVKVLAMWLKQTSSYKRVKGRSHTVEKRKAIHPRKPHATSQPSRLSHTLRLGTDSAH